MKSCIIHNMVHNMANIRRSKTITTVRKEMYLQGNERKLSSKTIIKDEQP